MASREKPSASRRAPVQERSRQTVGAILEAAARIYDRGTATTNGIARLAGVSIGSLYEYFPNKDAILEALVDRHVREAEESLRREIGALDPASTPLPVGIARLVRAMLELHGDRPGLHRRIVRAWMGRAPVRHAIVAAEQRLRGEIASWLRGHPEVSVTDVERAARVVVEGTNALVHRFVEDDEGLAPAAFVEDLTRLWTGYLGGR